MTKKISTLILTMVGLLTLLPIIMLLWQSIQTFDENFMPVLALHSTRRLSRTLGIGITTRIRSS